ncbi:pseudouridine synthase family protein [Mesomycoplasma lagogenitalium]|uniref:RNA pseudouridylate synthase n=1 Tax=Mesomycoplasma lagogenitalium TaxID=171286 RepID=A0ABY8LVS2_9BACT|nr:RluA family pseudouridine synthase [Mesomycoplasma lagogenitalium]WGI36526.1 RluA family pseudouridine synthase [Mesomycoplasma lagogenitalium]
MKKIIATFNDQNRTLYKFIIKHFNKVPLSKIEKIFRKKDIKVNGTKTNNKKYLVMENDVVEIYGLDEKLENSNKINLLNSNLKIDFNVIYEDKNILIVNKKNNIAIHGEDNCLDNQVLQYLKFIQNSSFVPSHIGRIDKSTSGIVVYAKNYHSLVQLKEKQSNFDKIYIFKSDIKIDKEFQVSYFLEKDDKKMKMKVVEKSNELAITDFYEQSGKKYAKLITGKKHQIRVSLSKLGFPIYGDKKYGGKKEKRVYLHSHILKFKNLNGELKYLNEKEFICYPKW